MANKLDIATLDINTTALISKMSETRAEIEKLQAAQKQLTSSNQTTSDAFSKNAVELSRLQSTYNSQKNVVAALSTETSKFATATDSITNAVNQENITIAAVRENNKKLLTLRNQLNLATVDGQKSLTQINAKLDQNNTFIKENVSAYEQQKIAIGDYKNQVKEAFGELNIFNGGLGGFMERSKEAGGTGALLKKSFLDISAGIGGMVTQSLAFIATPIGAVIAGVVAAAASAKAIFDFNLGLQESNKELKALGVNANEISKVRSEITATAEVFDKDFKDIASKANSLAKSYGISMSEANKIITEGLANGGAQNAEFLDSIGEYDAMFAKAGYSAQEFVNIVNTGYELGIYADKLPDALKEADLALKEQTKSTKDALVNAFGAPFSDELLAKVRTGEITTKDALQSIAAKTKEVQLTQQQQAQLTADVFKGAGEDAGGALVILDAVNKAANKSLSDSAKSQLELIASTEKLNKIQAELFEVKSFGDVWTNIKAVSIDALATMLEYVADIKKDLQPLIDLISITLSSSFQVFKTSFSVAFNAVIGGLKLITNSVATFFNFFKAILTGDFQGAINALKNGFLNVGNIIESTFGKVKNSVINSIKSILENVSPVLKAVGVNVDALQKKLDGLKSKEVKLDTKSTTTTSTIAAAPKQEIVGDTKQSTDGDKKKIEDAKKAAIQLKKDELDLYLAQQGIKKKSAEDEIAFEKQVLDKKLAVLKQEYDAKKITQTAYSAQSLALTNQTAKTIADIGISEAQRELDNFKKIHQTKIDTDKFFTQEKLNQIVAENELVKAKEIEFQQQKLDAGVINQQQYNDAVNLINENTRIKNEDAEKVRAQAKKDQEAIDLENKRIVDEEKFTNEFDLQTAREETRYQAEIAAAEKTGASKDLINQKHADIQKKIEDAKFDAQLQAAEKTFGEIAQLLGENTVAGKAAAIAQSTINTYNGITNVWDAESVLPEPFATAQKVVSTGVVLSSGLAAVNKIKSTQVPSRAGGGAIPTLRSGVINNGSNLSVPLSNGDDTLAYVRQGEMILNEQQQARAGGSAFFRSLGVPTFAGGGQVAGNSSLGSLNGVKIDFDNLAVKIAEANRLLPAPVVSVQEILDVSNRIYVAESGANF